MLPPAKISGAEECRQLKIKEPDGSEISAWFFRKHDDDGLVLVSHGNAGNISHRLELARHLMDDTNCSVLLYDYKGYGDSPGVPTVNGILTDGMAAYDYARSELHFPEDEIILYGESLGCAVSCHIGAHRKPKAIIFQSGFRSLPAIAKDILGPLKIIPGSLFPEPKLDNEKLLMKEHAPLLIMHGKKDEVIPFRHGKTLFHKASEPKTFVPLEHSRHNDTYTAADKELFDRSITDFVRKVNYGPD